MPARSYLASTLVGDLLALPPDVRNRQLDTLTQRDLAVVLSCCRRELGTPYGLWQDDPVGFVERVCGDRTWSKQRRILRRLAGRGRLAVPATHSPGKTWLGARIVAWWISVWPVGTAMAVTTAPKFRQVRAQMWPGIRHVHSRAKLPGKVLTTEWQIGELRDPVAYGFSAADTDEDAVQGLHAPHLLLVVDEAGGMSLTLGRAIEGAATANPDVRLLAIGNPPTDEEGGWFEQACSSPLWDVERIAAADTPAFTGELTPRCTSCPPGVPPHRIAMHLTTPEWVDEVVDDFGSDSAFVVARVHAEFPRAVASKTIPLSWIENAAEQDEGTPLRWVRLGVDVAADGGDELVIARSIGWSASLVHRSSGAENAQPLDVAGHVKRAIEDAVELNRRLGYSRPVHVKIDSIGVGWGVWGVLDAWQRDGVLAGERELRILPVNVAESAIDDDRFHNKRAELWWTGRRLLTPRDGRAQAVPPNDRRTHAQLSAPDYHTDSRGRVVIESKIDLRRKGKPSPDRAEAVLLAWYEPEPPGEASSESPAAARMPKPPKRYSGAGASVTTLRRR